MKLNLPSDRYSLISGAIASASSGARCGRDPAASPPHTEGNAEGVVGGKPEASRPSAPRTDSPAGPDPGRPVPCAGGSSGFTMLSMPSQLRGKSTRGSWTAIGSAHRMVVTSAANTPTALGSRLGSAVPKLRLSGVLFEPPEAPLAEAQSHLVLFWLGA